MAVLSGYIMIIACYNLVHKVKVQTNATKRDMIKGLLTALDENESVLFSYSFSNLHKFQKNTSQITAQLFKPL